MATPSQTLWRHERPWGSFQNLSWDAGWKAKRLTINPGQATSLQRHLQRSEVWTVAAGVAEVTRNNFVSTLIVGDTLFIGAGVVHRIANPGDVTLEIIEVQIGPYLGEDDIERLEDKYGRVK